MNEMNEDVLPLENGAFNNVSFSGVYLSQTTVELL